MDCRKIGFGIPGDLPERDGPKSIFRDECLRRIEDAGSGIGRGMGWFGHQRNGIGETNVSNSCLIFASGYFVPLPGKPRLCCQWKRRFRDELSGLPQARCS